MAKKATWRRKIREACEDAGTYQPFFDMAIDQLAGIMETRDAAQAQFKESGNMPVVMHVNKGGHKNVAKNPALTVINECNQQALAYWRDLGLTPKGFKALGNDTASTKKEATFEDLLSGIGI